MMNGLKFTLLSLVLVLGVILSSCLKDEEGRTASDEKKELEAYLLENNVPESAKQESGLYYIELAEGDGAVPTQGEEVKVLYKGMFLDGAVFDQSQDANKPFEFPLGKGYVIPGWDLGIALMKKGGKARLIIPSGLAYGAGYRSIPPYSTLVFDVELLK